MAAAEPPSAHAAIRAPCRGWAPLGIVVGVAAGLRAHRLASQLWLDEIDALTGSVRRPAAAIVSEWPAGTSHVLHDLLAHACWAWLGESPAALRLPAALFGIAGVAALFALAERRFGCRTAVAAGGLLAVSYLHVFQSQNARGYTALIFFGLLASSLLLRWQARPSPGLGEASAYAAACALAAYSIPLGMFVLLGHSVAVALAAALSGARRRPAPWPLRGFSAAAVAGAGLTLALYAPFAASIAGFVEQQSRLPTDTTLVSPGFLYRLGVAREALRGLGQAFGGAGGLLAAAVVGLAGLFEWLRRDAASLAVVAAPVALQMLVLPALGVPLSPRYFALALPVLTLSLALGLSSLTGLLAARLAGRESRRWRMQAALLGGGLLVASLPLLGYYRLPKQDFRGAIQRIEAMAQPDDLRAAVHDAGRAISGFYGAGFVDVRTLGRLQELERQGRRVLLATTLERFLAVEAPELYAHVQASYRKLEVLPGSVAGAELTLYVREPAP